jgi:hypothetical protein
MRLVGLVLIVVGILQGVQVFRGEFGALIGGILYLCMGVWTRAAARSFQQVVDTQGSDISHLMNALGELLKLYDLLYMVILLVIVILIIGGIGFLVSAF